MLGRAVRPRTAKRLYVSSAGGHFTELLAFAHADRRVEQGRQWALPRTPQTTSSVGSEDVTWLRPIGTRGYMHVLRALPAAWRLHRRVRPIEVVTTGAAQAIPHLLVAALHGTRIRYIESATRFDGPSVTGRLASMLPRTTLVSQTTAWTPRWTVTPDLFSGFRVTERARPAQPVGTRRVLLSLGTERFPFARALEQVRGVVSAGALQIQYGSTPPGTIRSGEQADQWLASEELEGAQRSASSVVVHGGVGSILAALRLGKVPVVLARDPALGEHVDAHQMWLCERLRDRGLVVYVAPGEQLSAEHLESAEQLRVELFPGGDEGSRPMLEPTQIGRTTAGSR